MIRKPWPEWDGVPRRRIRNGQWRAIKAQGWHQLVNASGTTFRAEWLPDELVWRFHDEDPEQDGWFCKAKEAARDNGLMYVGEAERPNRKAGEPPGKGWPNSAEPGVPAFPLEDGFHWMQWPGTGTWTIGQWKPDIWCWVLSYRGEMVGPEQMDHLDYRGRALPPEAPSA